MTAGGGHFAYAQPRLQARLGPRLDVASLQRVRTARDLPAYLQHVRSTPFAHDVARLTPGMDVHEIERRMRGEWVANVEEIAHWQPAPWQASIRWMQWLPYLPALQKLASGGRAPAWTREDPVLARIVAVAPAGRSQAVRDTELAPLQGGDARGESTVQAWLAHWRRLWPASRATRAVLEDIVRAVERASISARELPLDATSERTMEALRRRLLRIFRRHPLSPVTAVAFLGLDALARLELRGAVTARAVLGPVRA